MCKNSVSQRSHDALQAALLSLMEGRNTKSITVTDVVQAAGVTRPTFYTAYGDLPTAFTATALDQLSAVFDEFSLDKEGSAEHRLDEMETAFTSIATRLQDHRPFYLHAVHGPGGLQILQAVNAFIAERLRSHSPVSPALRDGPLPLESSSSALAAGITWLTLEWLDSDTDRNPAEFACLIRDVIVHSVSGGPAHQDGTYQLSKENR